MMDMIRYGALALAVTAGSTAFAAGGNNRDEGLSADDLHAITRYAQKHGMYAAGPEAGDEPQGTDSLSGFETRLPNAAEPPVSKLETRLLISYMENPSNADAARLMAAYHLLRLPFAGQGAGANTDRLKRAIYAQYFLSRARRLGAHEHWIDSGIRVTTQLLAGLLPADRPLDLTEGNDAHKAFLEAFNYTEANRYVAEERLLKDLLRNPTNLLTNQYSAAVNLWNAGEARYDDPTLIYSYLKASYFGGRSKELSMRAEQEWVADPANHKLFRLAPAVGGFYLPARRWLAKFHGDQAAVALVNDELREWFGKYPSFYMFPIGVVGFTEPENFFEGFMALLTAMNKCTTSPDVFCEDNARAPYNVISFFMYSFDYFLKLGDTGTAASMLTFKYVPQFRYDTWYLGQPAWMHREENMEQIAVLYQNGDPADDPVNGFLKRRKWGPESSTCQLCHQAQGATFTEEEKQNIKSLPESELYVQSWPVSRVGWDAHVIAGN